MDSPIESLKIVLVGEAGVGKTSIISQFVEQLFQEDIQSSTGGTFSSKTCTYGNNKILKLEIWDTAGQEKYRSLTKMFYKDAKAVIMVYDVTREDSFEELQKYWYDQIKESSPANIILVIAANKSDLIEQEKVDEGEARNYAKEINALYVSTSAKNSNGINNLFEEIAKKYTGSTNVEIKEEEGETEPPEDDNNNVKIGKGKDKKEKKKGFC